MKEWLLKNFFNKASTENKEKQAPENSSTMPYEPIVFVNKPISNIDDDIVGFRSQIETIKEAIDSGADMIALVADYGAGKSVKVELEKSFKHHFIFLACKHNRENNCC